MVDLGNLMGAFKFVSEVEKYNGISKKESRSRRKKAKNLLKHLWFQFSVVILSFQRPEQNNLPR